VRLWDLHSLTPLASFTIEDFPEVCALTADGDTVIVGDRTSSDSSPSDCDEGRPA
jgi:hypothetical protein